LVEREMGDSEGLVRRIYSTVSETLEDFPAFDGVHNFPRNQFRSLENLFEKLRNGLRKYFI
jgi:hypothetical protein